MFVFTALGLLLKHDNVVVSIPGQTLTYIKEGTSYELFAEGLSVPLAKVSKLSLIPLLQEACLVAPIADTNNLGVFF